VIVASMFLTEAYERYLVAATEEQPFDVAPDLEFVIWDEEQDFIWKFVELPIDAVGADLSFAPTNGCLPQDEDERFATIRTWMEINGVEKALRASPPIARMTDEEGLELVDGRHRLALARHYGITSVRFLVGCAPGWVPDMAVYTSDSHIGGGP
jgi:hypothetical protein